ncbi:MAG TPA: RidA family protein [Spirochaetia bacterium]|nr:RidA family protein [Spirochaetia bacterium]
MKRIIQTDNAPKAIGPYSQAVEANGFLFISGQLGIDPKTGKLGSGVEEQARNSMQNLGHILRAAGIDYRNIVRTGIFLKDMSDFQTVNAVYATFFQESFPARATIAVGGLPMDAAVEIEAVALLG